MPVVFLCSKINERNDCNGEIKLSVSPTKNISESKEISAGKLSYTEQKEKEKIIRKAEKEVLKYEAEIANIESKIAEIEQILSSGIEVDANIYTQHAELQKNLENVMEQWEFACEEVERLKVS